VASPPPAAAAPAATTGVELGSRRVYRLGSSRPSALPVRRTRTPTARAAELVVEAAGKAAGESKSALKREQEVALRLRAELAARDDEVARLRATLRAEANDMD